jgi:inner membrane protein
MPSAFTHAFAALALGKASTGEKRPARFWVLSAICAVVPDADVISFAFGVRRGSMFGHRGLTHSLLFALLLAVLVVLLGFRKTKAFTKDWWKLLTYFFIVTASHGLLDALTNGGSGVAFFAPFDTTRYFFSWRPIEVSPIGLGFFSSRGLKVIASEFVWVWIPALLLVAFSWLYRRLRASLK